LYSRVKKYNRRIFLKSVVAGISIATLFVWDKMVITNKKNSQVKYITLALQTNKKINFADNFIIINNEGKIKVLSSRCTHLGCKINESKQDNLLCPCHGSSFNLDGSPIKGPAIKPLEEKDFTIDKANNTITIIV